MGEVLEFVQKTEAEKRGFSNGHKFRTNAPEDMAVPFTKPVGKMQRKWHAQILIIKRI